MKTETEGLSRERFEKWFSEEHPQHSLEWQPGGGHYRYAFTEELWRTAQHFYAAASSQARTTEFCQCEVIQKSHCPTCGLRRQPGESPSQASTQPPSRNDWEGKVLAFAREYGEPWSIRAAMENWKERYLKAESISQATKEEWAQRIAEEECSGNLVDLAEDEVKSQVLALMTNEEGKIKTASPRPSESPEEG